MSTPTALPHRITSTAAPASTKTIKAVSPDEYQRFQERQSRREETAPLGHLTYSYGELLQMDFHRAPWLFKGLMRTNEVAMVYAQTGVGKTWLTLALSMIAAGGGQVLEWTNDTPRKVLYLDGEMDAAELVGRMKQLAEGLNCNPEALSKNLVLCARQMQKVITGNFIEIETDESQLSILKYAEEHKFDLVVIDNLTTLSGQLDENASKDMKLFNSFLLRAKQKGIGVLVVHHQGKQANSGPRGSTAMMATFNLILKLEASTQERAAGDKDARFTVVFEKNRGNVDSRPLPVRVTAGFEASLGETEDALMDEHIPLTLMIDPDAESNALRAVRLLKTCKYKTVEELAKGFGVRQGTMSKILKTALGQGHLKPTEREEYFRRARETEDEEDSSEF